MKEEIEVLDFDTEVQENIKNVEKEKKEVLSEKRDIKDINNKGYILIFIYTIVAIFILVLMILNIK